MAILKPWVQGTEWCGKGEEQVQRKLVFRGYKLSPLNQKVLTQNRVFDLFRDCLGGAF